nr:unnamed protein product [Callosobruchus analis]
MIAIKSCFSVSRINVAVLRSESALIDVAACKLILSRGIIIIYSIYIPPSLTVSEYELFFEAFELFNNAFSGATFIIGGDFNAPKFNNDVNDSKVTAINNFCSFLDVSNVNTITNVDGRLLDLIRVLCNCEGSVDRDNHPLLREDEYHPAIAADLNINNTCISNSYNTNNIRYNFRRADFASLYSDILNVDWTYLQSHTSDVNEACNALYQTVNDLIETHVPKFRNNSRRYPPWFNSIIISNIKKKDNARRNFKKYNTEQYKQKFYKLRETVKKDIKISYAAYIQNMENSIHTDPSKFWTFVRNKNRSTRIPGIMKLGDTTLDNTQEIVNGFAQYFSSVYQQSDVSNLDLQTKDCTNSIISLIEVSEDDVIRASKKLPNKLTSGVDIIPSFIVKDCIHVLAKPLSIIFNIIINTKTYPDIWKTTKVCPVLKTGDFSEIENYRPISIICNFSKLFEIILYNTIYTPLKRSITVSQHGFVTERSTVTNLACLTQFISEKLDNLSQVDVIYTDFQKAFDSIDHFLLLSKLRSVGLSNGLVSLIHSYLRDRIQRVEYGGYTSVSYVPTSGVPQGSNLGPLLFLIYINDLATELCQLNLLFADDLKMYTEVNNYSDCILLQNDLNILSNWCVLNKLNLNIGKCKVLSFCRKLNTIVFDYRINNVVLERCQQCKDLGVIFDCKFTFSEHIKQMVSLSNKMLGFCVRNWSRFTNSQVIKAVYISFIQSKLEYAAFVWSPLYRNAITDIESVQRKALKYMYFKAYGIYPDKGFPHKILLQTMDLDTLAFRRQISDLTMLYNLLNNKLDCPALISKINFNVPNRTTRSNVNFYIPFGRTNVSVMSPVNRMCVVFDKYCQNCDIHFENLEDIMRKFKATYELLNQ